jgi:hypothetical protein
MSDVRGTLVVVWLWWFFTRHGSCGGRRRLCLWGNAGSYDELQETSDPLVKYMCAKCVRTPVVAHAIDTVLVRGLSGAQVVRVTEVGHAAQKLWHESKKSLGVTDAVGSKKRRLSDKSAAAPSVAAAASAAAAAKPKADV